MESIRKETSLGTVLGNETPDCFEYLGIPYARADRFAYAVPVDRWADELDATRHGNACPQYRMYFPQLENPVRRFYQREFRDGMNFHYDEECLNLDLYVPKQAAGCPVIVFLHGGGFNSGSNAESPFRGYELAKRGILTVVINYRVGILGYLTHEEIRKRYGREGNFGLDDQLTAIRWVKAHIADFGGDPDNITLMGQSAGAISIQFLCLNHDLEGLFRRVIMMSGGGMFPRFALPRKAEDTRPYWLELMERCGCSRFDALCALDIRQLLTAEHEMKMSRKDTTYHTMPVVDGVLIHDAVDRLIGDPLPVGYMIGFTNNDMYAPVMAFIGTKFGKANGAYLYYFDLDSPGDRNAAFHSSDLRYMFGTLGDSWRPYGMRDYEVSRQMTDYAANFARTGDPNAPPLPVWTPASEKHARVLCFRSSETEMGHPGYLKMAKNMLTIGDPKGQLPTT